VTTTNVTRAVFHFTKRCNVALSQKSTKNVIENTPQNAAHVAQTGQGCSDCDVFRFLFDKLDHEK